MFVVLCHKIRYLLDIRIALYHAAPHIQNSDGELLKKNARIFELLCSVLSSPEFMA